MDDTALLLSLGFARPSAREAAESFRQVFPGVSARGGGRVRAFDERYLRRWEVEVSFRDMKTTLRYEFIRGRTPLIVKLEVGVLILAYNLMRYVIARGRARGQRRGIASTAAAAMAFISTVPMLYAARRSLERAFSRLVAAVAADALSRRKRKNYVRAVKRRPKPYPLLTKPRSEYRQEEVI